MLLDYFADLFLTFYFLQNTSSSNSAGSSVSAPRMYRFLEDASNATDTDHDNHDESGEVSNVSKPWGDAIAASLIIQAVTFSGLLLLGFGSCFRQWSMSQSQVSGSAAEKRKKANDSWKCMVEIVIPSFAAGALLATAVFLIIPEAFELLNGGHAEHGGEEEAHEEHAAVDEFSGEEEVHAEEEHEESGAAWKFGVALLCGFLFPILLGSLFHNAHQGEQIGSAAESVAMVQASKISNAGVTQQQAADNGGEVTDHDQEDVHEGKEDTESLEVLPLPLERPKNIPLAASILVGDIFHNLADGFFLGSAFLLCSNSLAWTIVATTVYHELAQEIADFFLLTHHCGLSTVQALCLNFIAGFSVILGVIIVFTANLSDQAIGAILSVSAGVYLYIAVGECLPRIQAVRKTKRDTFLFLLCFVIGAVPIGLVLLNHVDCEVSTTTEHVDEHTDEQVVEEEAHDEHEGRDHF